MEAGRRFTEELGGRTGADGKPLDAKQALALWTEIANRQMLETQRSEPFLESQREMIRASTELRLAQQRAGRAFRQAVRLPDPHRAGRRAPLRDRDAPRAAPCAASASRGHARRAAAPPLPVTPPASSAAAPADPGRPAKGDAAMADAPSDPAAAALADAARLGTKLLTGGRLLHGADATRTSQIATTPKDLVWQQDKVSLFHYRPLAEKRIGVPVLICYGLIGRWTMTDLQEDRSLVRNLLNLGIDLYVVDWGNPSRADRYLTLDDYILGYLDGCVTEIARRAGVAKVNLLGVCEGGVFTTAFAALCPERVNTLDADHHADRLPRRHGREPARATASSIIWTRSLDPGGHRPADRRQRQPARRVHGRGVQPDDADAQHDEIQSGTCSRSSTTRSGC